MRTLSLFAPRLWRPRLSLLKIRVDTAARFIDAVPGKSLSRRPKLVLLSKNRWMFGEGLRRFVGVREFE